MTIQTYIARALARDHFALSEHESKQVLKSAGISLPDEILVTRPQDAAAAADEIGYPVVLKGVGSGLLHKSDRGLVKTALSGREALEAALEDLRRSGGHDLEGYLIQSQIPGRREFVAGVYRDAQFGPVIMFGLGGIYTEALADTVCRLAPLSAFDAEAMIAELRAQAYLGSLRGERAVDRDEMAAILMKLSRLAVEHPEIAEIDLNPIMVRPDGRIAIADALVVCRPLAPAADDTGSVPAKAIRSLFYPRAIAFIGASAQFGKWGHMLFTNTVGGGYEGSCYLVNPRGGRIAGRPVYRTIEAVPAAVDLAVVTIPAARVLDLIPQLQRKNVRNMLLITSGFGETGDRGKALEADLVRSARQAGILVLGPNTMGICNPHIQFYGTGSPVMPRAGSTAVVAQSGNMGTQLLAFAEQQGIGIRGFAGSGNEAMLTIEDFIAGFEGDALTRTVMLYIESIKNGRRFFENARRLGRRKPIVLLKGGQTRAGNRAAASHTGALASDAAVFNAMCRQAGIVKVDRPMELLDLSAAFASLPLPRGSRAAIMTLGGGWGVVTADLCAANGLEVPELDPEVVAHLDELLPPYWSRANPVDLVGENDLELPLKAMEALLRWDGCDALINLGILGRRIFVNRLIANSEIADPDLTGELNAMVRETITQFETHYIESITALMERYGKPVYGVSLLQDESDRTVYPVANSPFNAVFYETPERAVQAFARMVVYRRFQDQDRK
ncbi:MAG: acetate--CoA ligase family protein [Desulfobacterales bacterium]|nr:acetate--CoA ligase family protein [Desulfobacterales bacterium]